MGKKYDRTALEPALRQKDEELQGSTSMFGQTMLTNVQYNSAMRITMDTSHQRQCVSLISPEFPFLYTGGENTVGKHSNSYKQVKNDCVVIRKIEKYRNLIDKPYVYLLVLYTKSTDTYDIMEIKYCEELTESFAFKYNNDYADTLDEGDEIPAGTVITKSNSYDEYFNYCFGLNALTMYTLDPYTTEDAAVVSESFAERGSSLSQETCDILLNQNDYLVNIYGDKKTYRAMPKLGENINGILMASRRYIRDQALYDFRDTSLNMIMEGDTVYPVDDGSFVIDYDIYCNNVDLEENTFTREIITLMDEQDEYYEEIYDVCKTIKESGSNYTKNVNYFYKRASDMLNKEAQWIRTNTNSAFSGTMIRVKTARKKKLEVGSKIVGRYGNKSVISKILPDDQMPKTESGLTVDLQMSLFGIINRTTAMPVYEMEITYLCRKLIEEMKKKKTFKEKESLFFDFMKTINEPEYKEIYDEYKKYSKKEQQAFIYSCMDDFIYFKQPPMFEYRPLFYRIMDVYDKFDWANKDEEVTVYKNGRRVKSIRNFRLGYMYTMILKQTGESGASMRNTGPINACEYPTKSNRSKNKQKEISDKPIRFGEYETLAFLIGMMPEDIVLFNAWYRTSVEGRSDFVKYQVEPYSKRVKAKIPEKYTSRIAEIFNVYLKSIGLAIDFIDEDKVLTEIDADKGQFFEDEDGKGYLCDELTFINIQRWKEVEKEVLAEKPFIDDNELHDCIVERLEDRGYINGPIVDVTKFLD